MAQARYITRGEKVAELIRAACDMGYEYAPFRESVLGYGGFALIAPKHPEKGKYYMNIVVEEQYRNEWSSDHKIWRCKKISKNLQAKIDKYEMECMENE